MSQNSEIDAEVKQVEEDKQLTQGGVKQRGVKKNKDKQLLEKQLEDKDKQLQEALEAIKQLQEQVEQLSKSKAVKQVKDKQLCGFCALDIGRCKSVLTPCSHLFHLTCYEVSVKRSVSQGVGPVCPECNEEVEPLTKVHRSSLEDQMRKQSNGQKINTNRLLTNKFFIQLDAETKQDVLDAYADKHRIRWGDFNKNPKIGGPKGWEVFNNFKDCTTAGESFKAGMWSSEIVKGVFYGYCEIIKA